MHASRYRTCLKWNAIDPSRYLQASTDPSCDELVNNPHWLSCYGAMDSMRYQGRLSATH